jgi:hypothetical protein
MSSLAPSQQLRNRSHVQVTIKPQWCPFDAACFLFSNYSSTPPSMERLQPLSSTAVASEHLPDPLSRENPASSRDATQNNMNSPPSTIPLDEASFSNSVLERQFPCDDDVRAETRFHPIMIDDSEDDQLAQSSPRPRLAKARRPDYAGRAFLDAIDGASTGLSHRRKRKRGHASMDADPAEVKAILVSISHLNFRFRLTVL